MKLLILLFGMLYVGLSDACIHSPFTYDSTRIKQLAEQADRIVWVELLDKQVSYPPSLPKSESTTLASTLEELLALVERDKAARKHPTFSMIFNELHLIKGQSLSVSAQCSNCDPSSSRLYRRMRTGEKYVLYYLDDQLIGASPADTTARYQAQLKTISDPLTLVGHKEQ